MLIWLTKDAWIDASDGMNWVLSRNSAEEVGRPERLGWFLTLDQAMLSAVRGGIVRGPELLDCRRVRDLAQATAARLPPPECKRTVELGEGYWAQPFAAIAARGARNTSR